MSKKTVVTIDEGEDPLGSFTVTTIKKNSSKEAFEKSVREQERDLLNEEFTSEKKPAFVINKTLKSNGTHRNPFNSNPSSNNTISSEQNPNQQNILLKEANGTQQKSSVGSENREPLGRLEDIKIAKSSQNDDRLHASRPKSLPSKQEESKTENVQLLPGERLVDAIGCSIQLMQYPHLSTEGVFSITNFKVQFTPFDMVAFATRKPKLKDDYLWMPLGFILKFEKSNDKKSLDFVYIDIYSKDGRIFKLKVNERQTNDSVKLLQSLHRYTFPERKEQLFAFEYGKAYRELEEKYKGWKIYDIEKEFRRQGVEFQSLSAPDPDTNSNYTFRLVDNSTYKICSTYPPKLLIPSKVSDLTYMACSKFRSRERVPAITYYYAKTKTTLSRSSQSKPGLYTNRCAEDEQVLRDLGNPLPNENGDKDEINMYIYDARPYLNAMATRLNGNGFEDTRWYKNCEIFFMDIDNIHHVRDNHRKLLNLCFSPEISNNKWYSQFESTNWLELISLIIAAALKVTSSLRNGKNCLVHCSDGWDRTSQILSLAQIMVDPYFRTIEGFEVLIMKDWIYFGHQFNTRMGHANKNDKDDQRSPVFLQFLDCVHQLLVQYPFAFEFNQKFLCELAYHAYSCQFGLFLCNCYQEMTLYKLEEKTICLWSYLNSQKDKYYNIYFNGTDNPIILKPSTHLKHLKLWEEHFLNYSWLSKPQFEFSETVVFKKDFYEHMLMKDRKKIKELKSEVEQLKARLRKYEGEENVHEEDEKPNLEHLEEEKTEQDERQAWLGNQKQSPREVKEEVLKGESKVQKNDDENGLGGGGMEDSYERIKEGGNEEQ